MDSQPPGGEKGSEAEKLKAIRNATITDIDIYGNGQADELAKAGAAMHADISYLIQDKRDRTALTILVQ